jgi:hypothetical protein
VRDLTTDGTIILKWNLINRVLMCELGSTGAGQGPVADSCGHGTETLPGNFLFSSTTVSFRRMNAFREENIALSNDVKFRCYRMTCATSDQLLQRA